MESAGAGKLVGQMPVRVLLHHWGFLRSQGLSRTRRPRSSAAVCAGCPSVGSCFARAGREAGCPQDARRPAHRGSGGTFAVLSGPQPGASQELGHVPPPSPAIWGSGWGLRGSRCWRRTGRSAGARLEAFVSGSQGSWPRKHWEKCGVRTEVGCGRTRPRTPWMSIWGKVVADVGPGLAGAAVALTRAPAPVASGRGRRSWQVRSHRTPRTAAARGHE